MSLIADSLKKAQKERDKEQSAPLPFRGSVFSNLSPQSQRILSLLGWVLILAGGLMTIFIPSSNYKAEVKPLLLVKPPDPGGLRKNTNPEPVIETETVSASQFTLNDVEEPPVSKPEPLAVLAMNQKAKAPEPGLNEGAGSKNGKDHKLPEPGKEPGKNMAAVTPVLSGSKNKKTLKESSTGKTGKNESRKKTQTTTAQESVKKSKTKPVPAVSPVSPEKEEVIAYEPFVKPESPLEQVAALTEGLGTESSVETKAVVQPETPEKVNPPQTESGTTGIQLAQEVPVTSLLKENPTPPESVQPVITVPEQTGQQLVGDESISFSSNETDQAAAEKMKTRFDPRALDDKSRYFNIATFHHRNKDYFAALEYYEKAQKLDPGNARIHNNRALIYKEMGRLQDAIGELLQAVRLDPAYVKAYNNLGLLYYQFGDGMRAIRNFEKAMEIDPRNVESMNNLAILYKQQRQFRRAEMLYRKMINLDPRQPEGHYNLALLYEQTGRLEKAIEHYNRFVDLAGPTRSALSMKVRDHIQKLEEKS
ncbi:tetratricopeptide repeat protein [Nitrospina gracilis]|uniref:tetratricopeptide repeat protein n=1 Tax=Nitrospina gracilis TaxID=35801 RepID=UPI001F41131A|nr:tetratricopeptide repeat protein [Nitrospina gracilis]MCF8721530.1 Flp pilus assembly protein TadD [Nitrospina gracilis Nb-211]